MRFFLIDLKINSDINSGLDSEISNRYETTI
jgi:hypothetical protein